MSSASARFACVTAPYVASKFGVEGFSDTLRRDLYSTGVTVHLIEPGFFAVPLVGFFTEDNVRRQLTEMFEKLPEEIKEHYSEEYIEKNAVKVSKLKQLVDTDLNKVVDVYVHAVTGRFPKAR